MPEYDWNLVVGREPKGYVEIQDTEKVVYGPVECVTVEDEMENVRIKVKWAITRKIDRMGRPTSEWEVVSNTPIAMVEFPNWSVAFIVEIMPEKGPRVRWVSGIIYLNDVHKVQPSEVRGLVPGPEPRPAPPPTPTQ